eukprot:2718492-Pyramimonas_sp.AAC.1
MCIRDSTSSAPSSAPTSRTARRCPPPSRAFLCVGAAAAPLTDALWRRTRGPFRQTLGGLIVLALQ